MELVTWPWWLSQEKVLWLGQCLLSEREEAAPGMVVGSLVLMTQGCVLRPRRTDEQNGKTDRS